jgi:hypothetical protein
MRLCSQYWNAEMGRALADRGTRRVRGLWGHYRWEVFGNERLLGFRIR